MRGWKLIHVRKWGPRVTFSTVDLTSCRNWGSVPFIRLRYCYLGGYYPSCKASIIVTRENAKWYLSHNISILFTVIFTAVRVRDIVNKKTHVAYNIRISNSISPDDVIKWKHFPRNWSFVRGIHRWLMDSPHKGQGHGALKFPLVCAWTNARANNRKAGDLRSHRAHYNFTVMQI